MARSKDYEAGAEVMQKLFGAAPRAGALPEAFMDITVEHLFGKVWTRPGLELQERSMITLAALAVLGRENELRIHLRGAANLGIPREKIEEIMMHLAHYGGWPCAVSALRVVKEVFDSDA